MKIALINGSPKVKNSASGVILQGLKGYLGQTNMSQDFHLHTPQLSFRELAPIMACDALVFALPLYVDGLPSHMVSALMALEHALKAAPFQTVYAILNCGFYEAHQNALGLNMMENWCTRAGLRWGQGLGVGAGGMLAELDSVPLGHGPKKNLGKALQALAQHIDTLAQGDTVFITPNFPRLAYKIAAEHGWRKTAKTNGLSPKDLFIQPRKKE